MPTITVTIQKELDVDTLMSSVFDIVTRNYSPWVIEYNYKTGMDSVLVKYFDEENKKSSKKVTVQDLADAYAVMYGKTYWGQIVGEPEHWDCLVADSMLQCAIFGEEVYA